jgi:hypothetical protein
MKFLQELTQWSDSTPNHTYLVVDSKEKMLGYVRRGSTTLELFKQPLPFDVRRRKFKEVANTYGYVEPELVNTANSWQIKSSSGNTYTIERNGDRLSCSCTGFRFKSKCRHVENFVEPA